MNYKVINHRLGAGVWVANAGLSIPAPPAAPGQRGHPAEHAVPGRDGLLFGDDGDHEHRGRAFDGSVTALGQTAGNNVVIPVRVPSGYWYSVTYTGTLTTLWVLD